MMTTCAVCGKRIVIPDPMFYVYKRGGAFFCSKNCMIVHNSKLTGKTGMFRTERKEKDMKHRLTRDQKQKAVEIALQGGDYMAYLKKAGAKNPSAAWWYIKATLEKANPEKYKELMKVMEENRPVVEIAEKLPPEAVAEVPEDKLEGFEPVNVKKKGTLPAGTTKKEVFEALKVPRMVVIGQDMAEGKDKTAFSITYMDEIEEQKKLDFEIMAFSTSLGDFQKDKRDCLVYWTTEEGEKICLTRMEWTKLANDIPAIMAVLEGV